MNIPQKSWWQRLWSLGRKTKEYVANKAVGDNQVKSNSIEPKQKKPNPLQKLWQRLKKAFSRKKKTEDGYFNNPSAAQQTADMLNEKQENRTPQQIIEDSSNLSPDFFDKTTVNNQAFWKQAQGQNRNLSLPLDISGEYEGDLYVKNSKGKIIPIAQSDKSQLSLEELIVENNLLPLNNSYKYLSTGEIVQDALSREEKAMERQKLAAQYARNNYMKEELQKISDRRRGAAEQTRNSFVIGSEKTEEEQIQQSARQLSEASKPIDNVQKEHQQSQKEYKLNKQKLQERILREAPIYDRGRQRVSETLPTPEASIFVKDENPSTREQVEDIALVIDKKLKDVAKNAEIAITEAAQKAKESAQNTASNFTENVQGFFGNAKGKVNQALKGNHQELTGDWPVAGQSELIGNNLSEEDIRVKLAEKKNNGQKFLIKHPKNCRSMSLLLEMTEKG